MKVTINTLERSLPEVITAYEAMVADQV